MRPSTVIGVALVTFLGTFALGWAAAWYAARPIDTWIRRGARLAVRRRLVIVMVGGLAAVLAAGVTLIRPPLPRGCDEFSHLLAADTFARGRLTNPTHPMWQHFETAHVIQQPTYASKYPPAQGLILALGQVLAGTPDLGVWISAALAAAAMCWMLQGWLPARWALLGGLLVALHPRLQLAWSQTYWGGNMALAGAALVLGAYPRIVRRSRWHDALLMGVGLAILANSRPYEGLAVSLPVAAGLLLWLFRKPRPQPGRFALRIVAPVSGVLFVTAIWMAYYNWRVSGDPLKMPYAVHEATYGCTPVFLWQAAGPIPEYRHEALRRIHVEMLRVPYELQQSWPGLIRIKGGELLFVWQSFLGVGLTIPLLLLPRVVRRAHFWLPLAMMLAGVAALAVTTWANPRYFAPALPALLLLVVQGLRHLRACTVSQTHRRSLLVRALVAAQVLGFAGSAWFHVSSPLHPFVSARAGLVRQLEAMPGQHLVLVRYSAAHDPDQEWVYNEADIDAAQVVWARSIDADADRRLTQYFARRQAWLLLTDETPLRPVPFPSAQPEPPQP